jgi:DNA-binding response OmpR family regulator
MPGPRVLVVDDEPRILDIVKYFLEQGGFEVEAFTNGHRAVESARRRPYDVAVLDIVLEGDDSGYEVASRLKQVPGMEETPVLFISSKVEMGELFLESFDGRAEFLVKPFKKDELAAKVESLAKGGGRRARRKDAPGRKR